MRRSAVGGAGDARIDQLQSIVCRCADGLGGEPGRVQNPEQQISGAIAGKYASRTIRPVRSGSKSQDQQLRVQRPERRNRPSPIIVGQVGPPLHRGNFPAVGAQTRTFAASYNVLVEFRR